MTQGYNCLSGKISSIDIEITGVKIQNISKILFESITKVFILSY
jgi:hypothetical protein